MSIKFTHDQQSTTFRIHDPSETSVHTHLENGFVCLTFWEGMTDCARVFLSLEAFQTFLSKMLSADAEMRRQAEPEPANEEMDVHFLKSLLVTDAEKRWERSERR